MAENTGKAAVGVVSAVVAGILGVAIISVIVGRNAQSANVISAGGGALSKVIGAAVAPVSGTGSTSLPTVSPSLLGTSTGSLNGVTNGGFSNLNSIASGINGITNLGGNQDFSSSGSDTSFSPDNAAIDAAYAAAL